ncbi:hypothetical protein DW741_11415 [Ruminococcaceae bacterium AM28-23LB]|nr:hypothetical protein DW741_11415 [Ruminococcaceae bacterium AM28-23LB]
MQCHFANLPPEYISELREEQSARRFTITGILLVQGNAGVDFSLKPFCQNIHRISELTGEQIVQKIRTSRA